MLQIRDLTVTMKKDLRDLLRGFTFALNPGDKAALAEETPVGRLGNAQEVARALLFLAGEEAGYSTGQVFGLNGGLVI